MCSIWDYSERRKLVSFNNGNPLGTRITSLQWVNEFNGANLLTASGMPPIKIATLILPLNLLADGLVRIYGRVDPFYDVEQDLRLVSAFRAISHLVEVPPESESGAGLVTAWNQPGGRLLAGGDSRIVVE